MTPCHRARCLDSTHVACAAGLPPAWAAPAPEPQGPGTLPETPYLCANAERTARFRHAVAQAHADVELWSTANSDPGELSDDLCAYSSLLLAFL